MNSINLKLHNEKIDGRNSPLTETLQSVDFDKSLTEGNNINASLLSYHTSTDSSLIVSQTSQLSASINSNNEDTLTKNVSYHNLQLQYENFNKCFAVLIYIQENQKIWIEDDVMIIDDSPYYSIYFFQSMNRYINSQGRDNLFDYLDVKFTNYMKYLDLFKNDYETNTNNNNMKRLIKNNISLIDNIIPGLHKLKGTYCDCERLQRKITSIILTFIDFKDFIEKINLKNSKKDINSRNLSTNSSNNSSNNSINNMLENFRDKNEEETIQPKSL